MKGMHSSGESAKKSISVIIIIEEERMSEAAETIRETVTTPCLSATCRRTRDRNRITTKF